VPNYLRALYVQFARNNLVAFHQEDGSGYEFMANTIIEIDKFNPQVASRAAVSFSMINRLDQNRKTLMQKNLKKIMESSPSRDTFEVVSKYLAQ
jgi:aminopeptidase N